MTGTVLAPARSTTVSKKVLFLLLLVPMFLGGVDSTLFNSIAYDLPVLTDSWRLWFIDGYTIALASCGGAQEANEAASTIDSNVMFERIGNDASALEAAAMATAEEWLSAHGAFWDQQLDQLAGFVEDGQPEEE